MYIESDIYIVDKLRIQAKGYLRKGRCLQVHITSLIIGSTGYWGHCLMHILLPLPAKSLQITRILS